MANEQKQPTPGAAEKPAKEINVKDLDAAWKTDFDQETMAQLYEQSFQNITEGQVVKGRVLQVNENEVLVDVGYKSEGVIPVEEFRNLIEAGKLKVGELIDVYLEKTEDSDGLVVLSKEKADKIKIWDEISDKFDNKEVIEGKVIERIKGGLTVDIGVRAFLPGSQIDLRPVRDPERLIGQTLRMRVIKLNKRRGNIVLSRRVILEDERKSMKEETLNALEEEAVVIGVVKNITEYGAFIDLGGIDGLLHITDMSWGRISHPSELLKIGDKVKVKVLKFDADSERVSLGMKQISEDPWLKVAEKYPVGSRVEGKVISLTDYGAFVELEEGVEGLVHVSEMSWTRRIRHPSKIVAIDEKVEAVVLDLDQENKRISLGMKQTETNPWDVVKEKYPIGTRVVGKVRNLTNFGAFVELEEGIDGLIHISDMSWTRRINHPSEVMKKGDEIETVVLDIDVDNERLSLGLKQLEENPWRDAENRFFIGNNVKGTVVRLTDFGAFVELEGGGIEGLVHISELSKDRIESPEEICKVGDELVMKVIKVDVEERRIGLSVRAYQEESERLEAEEGIVEQQDLKVGRSTMADVINQEALLRNIGFDGAGKAESKAEPKADAAEADTVTGDIPKPEKTRAKAKAAVSAEDEAEKAIRKALEDTSETPADVDTVTSDTVDAETEAKE
ncbi:MAG TPA: 30S ribosomal protein S1 [bacterium]|nr:30S ribosomal protein S1 [bacterium]